MATRRREQLAKKGSDLTLAGKVQRRGQGDGRAWLPDAILRKVFKEFGEGFELKDRSSAWNVADTRHHSKDALCTVAAAVLHHQAQGVERFTKSGGDYIVVHLECDSTPEAVRFVDERTVMALGGPEQKHMSATRDVFVINMRVLAGPGQDEPEEIFVAPLVLGDKTSGSMLNAIMTTMRDYKLDLMGLARRFEIVLWSVGIDGEAANDLLLDYMVERLPENVVPLRMPCLLHASNRIVLDHWTKSGVELINPVYSMTLLLQLGSNFEAFAKIVKELVWEDCDWSCSVEPDAAAIDRHRRMLRQFCPDACARKDWQAMLEACDFFNGDWGSPRVAHVCSRDGDGRPCCASLDQFRDNAQRHLGNLLLSVRPGRLCLSRWLKSVEAMGWFALGVRLHQIFSRAWAILAEARLTPRDLHAAGDANAQDQLEEDPNEDARCAYAYNLNYC